jgi:predicted HTH transcriptional regulator
MDLKELKQVVLRGENIHTEFKLKTNHPEKIAREIVAFANTEGGNLLIGVADDKNLIGLKYAEEDQFILEKAINTLISPLIIYTVETILLEDEKEILLFKIPRSKAMPHSLLLEGESKIYVRHADKSLQANKEMREVLKEVAKGKNYSFQYGEKENALIKYLDSNAYITVNVFSKIANIKTQIASRTIVLLVLAGVLRIEPNENEDKFYLK